MEIYTMKKKVFDLTRSERGQSMIIIAAVFVGLLALSGLAIDGGNLFMQRRRAQNAADAATLAGTHLISLAIQTCATIDMPALDAKIARTINSYAEQNGIADTNGIAGDEVNGNVVAYYVDKDGTSLGQVGVIGAMPLGTSGIRVEVQDQHETFFMPVVGIDTIPSSAQAMSMTGVVHEFPPHVGLIPVAVPQIVTEQLGKNEEWEMLDTSSGEFCYTDGGGTEHCIEDPGAPQNSQRGWLNLNHIFNNEYLDHDDALNRTFEQNLSNDGCPSSSGSLPGIRGYASGDCPYAYPVYTGGEGELNGDFVHGSPGSRASTMSAIYDGYAGQVAYAPVFDRVYLREEMVDFFDPQAESPDGYSNGGGFSSGGGGSGNSYYYHLVGYTAVGVGTTPSNSILTAEFRYAVIQAGIVPTGYDGTCTPLLHGITLWE
jgi:hypothetical protein